jgi:hypothetical protein
VTASSSARDLAAADESARVRRAASGEAGADELLRLARDPNVLVRAAVAINRSCGQEADNILAGDADERVRALLAGRIARLLPELAAEERVTAAEQARSTLALLVKDEAARVRAVIAEALKLSPLAPQDMILQLARDPEREISDMIIRLSPVLTDADLIALVATPPHPSTAQSIAGRAGLGAAVSDAIAARADVPAIRTMLANPSAQIREATLDGLIGRAPEHQEWHLPLVRHPALSASGARMLCSFVATQHLEMLALRSDLDPATAQAVRSRLLARIDRAGHDEREIRALITSLLRMKKRGELEEKVLLSAALQGDARRVAAILSVASEVPLSTIDRVAALRSAKALISLVWKAGFTMQAAAAVQTVLGRLGPAHVTPPTAEGGFPLSEQEMRWQLELLNEGARAEPVTQLWAAA